MVWIRKLPEKKPLRPSIRSNRIGFCWVSLMHIWICTVQTLFKHLLSYFWLNLALKIWDKKNGDLLEDDVCLVVIWCMPVEWVVIVEFIPVCFDDILKNNNLIKGFAKCFILKKIPLFYSKENPRVVRNSQELIPIIKTGSVQTTQNNAVRISLGTFIWGNKWMIADNREPNDTHKI